jgi:uncharacterized protein
MLNLSQFSNFDWDEGNSLKSQLKHNVLKHEVESVFFNVPLIILDDVKHSQNEPRYHALGKSDEARFLQVTFTIRNNEIRVISTRSMNKKERQYYENYSAF